MWRPAILQRAEALLLDEKAAKLLGLARVADQLLGDGFDSWLVRAGQPVDAADPERLGTLRDALCPLVDQVAGAFGAVGLGYYDAKLDRIVAYAPSASLGYLVGVAPPADHLGRVAMRERSDKIAVGSMVRGDAMNCMHPIIREERVIGFAFANESLDDIYRQVHAGAGRSTGAGESRAVLGLSSLAVLAGAAGVSASGLSALVGEAVRAGTVPEDAVRPLLSDLHQIGIYLRLFLENLQGGVVLVDPEGRVQYCNRAMGRFGLADPPLAVGRAWDSLALATDQMHTVEVAGGHRLCFFEDAGQTAQDSQYFERAERLALAGELATAIAHEIRNPLTVVAGSVQLIPQRLDDPEFLVSFAQIAGRELARVNRTIQGLLGFARYSEPQMQAVDLADLIGQAVEFIRWYAQKHNVEVVTLLESHHALVYGDAEHLQQALLNLMINGIQAMAEGGRLTVATEHPEGSRFIRVSVTDQGVGIAPDDLQRIWDVFYSSKPGGTGLGLPVVQRIVDEHRGYVEVESTAGRGTRFAVLLPLATGTHLGGEE